MSEIHSLLQQLRQPEYLHVLLNPLPLYGMAAGAFMLIVSSFRRESKGQTAALVWIALMGAVTWLVVRYGMKGYDRVFAMSSSPDAQQWLQVHMARAEKAMYVFYATGAAALATLLIPNTWPKAIVRLRTLTAILTVACVGLGGWIAHAGGQVRHSEFRVGPPSADRLPKGHHHHHEE